MKMLLLTLILPAMLAAQKTVLIDRNFKRPVQFTDSCTTVHIVQDYFPVGMPDIQLILDKTAWFIAVIDSVKPKAIYSEDIPVGNSKFLYTVSGQENAHRYQIILTTNTGTISSSLKLISFDDPRKRAIQKLLIFSDYIKNNLSAIGQTKTD